MLIYNKLVLHKSIQRKVYHFKVNLSSLKLLHERKFIIIKILRNILYSTAKLIYYIQKNCIRQVK